MESGHFGADKGAETKTTKVNNFMALLPKQQ